MPGRGHHKAPKFDFFGYGTLAVGVAALQLMLDRGPTNDWFGSTETWIEAATAGLCLYLFVVHMVTAREPLFSRALFKDRNFRTTAFATIFIMGSMYASLALVPPMLQNLYGYPVFTAGMIIMPRGIGAFISMTAVGRLVARFDARYLMGLGLILLALSFWMMSRFAPVQGDWPMISSGFVQGLSMGLIWVPMNTIAFATLPGQYRVQGATVSNLIRNVGGSIGISLLQVLLINNMQIARSTLVQHLTPGAPAVQRLMPTGEPTLGALQAMNGAVAQQSAFIAYIDDFWLMAIVTLCMVPVLFLLRKPARSGGSAAAAMAD